MKIISQLTMVEQWLDHVYIIIVVSMNNEYLNKIINTEHFRTIYIYHVQPLQTIVLISINYRKPFSNMVGHVYKNMCNHGYSCFVFLSIIDQY